MNEPTPPWRSFPSAPPAASGSEPTTLQDEAADGAQRWLVVALTVGGGSLAGLALIVAGAVALLSTAEPAPLEAFGEPLSLSPAGSTATTADGGHLLVDVAGAVARPGLHRLRQGARVGDALEAAGGFAPRADLTAAAHSLNLARPLEDGAKVLVPELGTERVSEASRSDGRIDLNRAGQAELESLPGIGPVTAGKIIEAREVRRFGSVRELRTRGLVGEAVFADIKDRISAS